MKREPARPTVEQARAKAIRIADHGGPDGTLRPGDHARYIAHLTVKFLDMELPDFEEWGEP